MNDALDAVTLLLVVFVAAVGSFLLQAWAVMLIAGGLHHAVSPSVPAISFGGAALVTVALDLIAGTFRGARN